MRAEGRVLELGGPTEPDERFAAYETVGRAMLDQCDLLLAVWNGEPAGDPGGTRQIVEIAQRKGLPILWIHSETGVALLKMRKEEVPLVETALIEQLERILMPPIG